MRPLLSIFNGFFQMEQSVVLDAWIKKVLENGRESLIKFGCIMIIALLAALFLARNEIRRIDAKEKQTKKKN